MSCSTPCSRMRETETPMDNPRPGRLYKIAIRPWSFSTNKRIIFAGVLSIDHGNVTSQLVRCLFTTKSDYYGN